jgi:uncharacterized protein with von Willebrand factor type A (vWA) domain
LTRRGRALQTKLLPYAVTVNSTALAGFTPKEVAQLQGLLAKLRANLAQRQRSRAGQAERVTRAVSADNR